MPEWAHERLKAEPTARYRTTVRWVEAVADCWTDRDFVVGTGEAGRDDDRAESLRLALVDSQAAAEGSIADVEVVKERVFDSLEANLVTKVRVMRSVIRDLDESATQLLEEKLPNLANQHRAYGEAVEALFEGLVSLLYEENDRQSDEARKTLGDGFCRHGVYVGGCGIDWMCGACEAGILGD